MDSMGATSSAQELSIDVAMNYLKFVRDLYCDKEEKFNEFLEVMKDFKGKRIDTFGVIERVEELFKDQYELMIDFNIFLPDECEIKIPKEKTSKEFQKAYEFVTKIKNRFKDDDSTYKLILDILTMYKRKIKSASEVYQGVSLILKNNEDLFMEFLHFWPGYCSSNAPNTSFGRISARRIKSSTMMRIMRSPYVEKMEDRDKNRKRQRGHINESLNQDEERENKRINHGSPNKEDTSHNPILNLNLSNSERCTPSYRLLPDSGCVSEASRKIEFDGSILNNKLILVPSYSVNHKINNQYEETLFRCEDDRFELDMLIELTKSTVEKVEELLEKMKNKTIKSNSPFCLKDHLTFQNLSCIERLYSDHGLDVIDVLSKNPDIALPLILPRLKQKQEEYDKCHTGFNKVWSEIYCKNHNM